MVNHNTDARRSRIRMLRPLRRRTDGAQARRFRRGVYLLPSMFTMASMFCGYACIVYAMRGEFATAAPFIGWAIVADMFDGRIARMTGTESEFGLEFDSLADIISFGIAPAILSFAWGLNPLGRLGWDHGYIGAGLAWGVTSRCPPELYRPRDEGVVVPVDRDGGGGRYVCMVRPDRLPLVELLGRTLEELIDRLGCRTFGVVGIGQRDDGGAAADAVRRAAADRPGVVERVEFCDRHDPGPFARRLRERGMLPAGEGDR